MKQAAFGVSSLGERSDCADDPIIKPGYLPVGGVHAVLDAGTWASTPAKASSET